MTGNPLYEWLNLQRALQVEAFNQDPAVIPEEEKPGFLLWNAFAATDELHEAMQEVGWKPWASSRHINREAFIGEMVDALHFIANMLLTVVPVYDMTVTIRSGDELHEFRDLQGLCKEVWERYQAKVEVNLQRQREGYDGIKTKCPECKRELVGDPAGGIYCPQHPNQKG